jgi:hypothetical protein
MAIPPKFAEDQTGLRCICGQHLHRPPSHPPLSGHPPLRPAPSHPPLSCHPSPLRPALRQALRRQSQQLAGILLDVMWMNLPAPWAMRLLHLEVTII